MGLSPRDADNEWLDLTDAVALLRRQISQGQERLAVGGDQGVRFGVGEITLELAVELASTGGADGGLRFGVVSAGGRRENTERATHKVTVRLEPRRTDGRAVEVGDVE